MHSKNNSQKTRCIYAHRRRLAIIRFCRYLAKLVSTLAACRITWVLKQSNYLTQ